MSANASQSLGAVGEELAAQHLERRGFRILDRNYRTRSGELDIVAFDGNVLVFCEVKSRRAGLSTGGALEAVSPAKRTQVRQMAGRWLVERRDRPYAEVIRFDAVGVTFDGAGRLLALEHLEAAF